jgi:hypothetical protein
MARASSSCSLKSTKSFSRVPARESQDHQTEDKAAALLRTIDLDRYVLPTDFPRLHVLKAGRFDEAYPRRVNKFDWERLYGRSPWLFQALANLLSERYAYTLIDSRTGRTDTSNICTMLMPQKLVVVFTPNRQSLTGVAELVKQATSYRRKSDDIRPLLIYPLASRIENSEEKRRERWRFGSKENDVVGYQAMFQSAFEAAYALPKCDLTGYFDAVQVQHTPRYAYGEEISVQSERATDISTLHYRYRLLGNWIRANAAPWESPAAATDNEIRLAQALEAEKESRAALRKLYQFALIAAVFLLAAIGTLGYEWSTDKNLGRSLFSTLGTHVGLNDSEAVALRTLIRSDGTVRKSFLQAGLQSGENASRLNSKLFPISIALSNASSSQADELYKTVIRPALTAPGHDARILQATSSMFKLWGIAQSITNSEADALASTLVERMSQPNDAYALSSLLGALKDKIEPATAQKLASILVERMSEEKDAYALSSLADGLGALKDKASPQALQTAASILVERMGQAKDAVALSALAEGLGAIGDEIDPPTAQKLASTLVERISREKFASAFRAWADGLGALKEAPPQTIQTAASTLVERMSQEKDTYTLRELAYGLGALKEAPPQTIQTAASTLVERMSQEKSASALSSLAEGLGALKEAPPQTIQTAASTLVERMSQEKDASTLGFLAQGLGALGDKIEPQTVQTAASTLVERMSQEKSASALRSLADGLGALKDKIDPPSAQKLASTLVERMSQEKDASALCSLAEGLGALPSADLSPKELLKMSAAFQTPDAACSALLAFDRATQESELPKQLRNPLCQENDWKQLALRAAQLSGQPIAHERVVEGNTEKEIEVDFPKLSDYVWAGAPWYDRYEISLPEVAAIVLLIITAVVFIFGLVRSRHARSTTGSA